MNLFIPILQYNQLIFHYIARDKINPPRADKTTTNQGGSFQYTRRPNAMTAREKSAAFRIALVNTGLYSAASRIPTTAAFTPAKAPCTFGCFLSSQPEHNKWNRNNGQKSRYNNTSGCKLRIRSIHFCKNCCICCSRHGNQQNTNLQQLSGKPDDF
jgi:hypothetical protein